jgi:WD40 repeat protein
MEGHTGWVRAVAVAPDGRRVVSGGDDTVRIWDLSNGRQERPLGDAAANVWSVAFTPDGRRIITGGADGLVRVWDLARGRLECTLEGDGAWVHSVAVAPDGRRVVSAGADDKVRVWDLASGRLELVLRGHTGWVYQVAVPADATRVVSAGDETVRVWDLASGEETTRWFVDPGVGVRACATAPDDPTLIVYGDTSYRVHVLRLLEAPASTLPALTLPTSVPDALTPERGLFGLIRPRNGRPR